MTHHNCTDVPDDELGLYLMEGRVQSCPAEAAGIYIEIRFIAPHSDPFAGVILPLLALVAAYLLVRILTTSR